MRKTNDNPFSGYGGIVSGDNFIGRISDKQVIIRSLIESKNPGNLAIVGEPRIGKSSLVYESLIRKREPLTKSKILPIMLNLGLFNNAEDFFITLVTTCEKEMAKLRWLSPKMGEILKTIKNRNLLTMEKYMAIQSFFEEVVNEGTRVIAIIDEFDHARKIFQDDVTSFQMIRELSYRPEWHISFLTTSRRNIKDIETQSKGISNLDGIFDKHYLGMFVKEDQEAYYEKIQTVGLQLTESDKEQIMYYCGGHPYLLAMLGYEIIETQKSSNNYGVEKAFHRKSQSFIDYFDHIMDLLEEDKSLAFVLDALDGPIDSSTKNRFEKLLHYGLFSHDADGRYTAFCKYFSSFIHLVQREKDYWPIWSKTERALRNIVSIILSRHYGENWLADIEHEQPKLTKYLDNMRKRQAMQQKDFGSRAATNLIDIAYIDELFSIILSQWDLFKTLLGRDQQYWNSHRELLGKIRNYYAHNSEDCIPDAHIYTAKTYCEEILMHAEKLQQIDISS